MRFLLVLCLVGFASSLSWRAVDPMLPVIASDLQVSLERAALLASAYSFLYAVMQLGFGPVGDAFGKGRLIKICLAVVAASLGAAAFAPGFGTLLVARGISGAFAGALIPMALAVIGDRVGMADRQVAIGRFLVASISGQVFGSAASGMLVDLVGWRGVFALAGGSIGCIWLVTLLFFDRSSEIRAPFTVARMIAGYRSVLANPISLLVFATGGVEGALMVGLMPFVAGMVIAHGAAGSFQAGIVIACFALGGVSFGVAIRWLILWLAPSNIMRAGAVLIGGAFMATALPVGWGVIAGLFAFAGFGFYMVHNTMQTRATELSPTARGSAVSLYASAFFIGQGLGPVIGGGVLQVAGYGTLYVGAGLFTIVLSFAAAALIGHRDTPMPDR